METNGKNTTEKAQKPKRITLRQCEIACNLDQFDLKYMERVLTIKKKETITHWAYIIHDKDTYDKDGERADGSKYKKGDLKAPHIHLMMKFKNPQAMHNVADWFEVNNNQVEKIKAKWVTALRYLIHENHPEKYQYNVDEVKSNFDYSEEKDKIGYNKNASQLRKREIVENITSGVWKIKDIFMGDKITGVEYSEYSNAINSALLYRQKQLELMNTGRNMKVIYIQGESGSGKTTMAKMEAERLGYDYYVSSGGNNPMDNYMGQMCVILDDFRPKKMDVSDLLKLLDNHTSSMVNARYNNKYMGECKLIILTNVHDLETFFNTFENTLNEPIKQLKRRCGSVWEMTDETLVRSKYDKKTGEYIRGKVMANPVSFLDFDDDDEEDDDDAFAAAYGVELKNPKLKKANSVKTHDFDENINFDSVYG